MPQVEQPQTWGEVAEFVKLNRLDQDEYFMVDDDQRNTSPVWGDGVWYIAIWMVEGSNEGFYLHVDAIVRDSNLRGGRRESRALGKFWSVTTAMHAQNLLWHYIYGFRLETHVGSSPQQWTGG